MRAGEGRRVSLRFRAGGGERVGGAAAGRGLLPATRDAILAQLGQGAPAGSVPAGEIEAWTRAVAFAHLLVRAIDDEIAATRPATAEALRGAVHAAVTPAFLAWLAAPEARRP